MSTSLFVQVVEFFRLAISVHEPPFPEALIDLAPEYIRQREDFPFSQAFVVHPYSPDFASELKRFKYRAERSVIRRLEHGLRRLAKAARSNAPPDSVVTYPPSPFFRTFFRGYDHTALLAKAFAQYSGFPCIPLLKTTAFRNRQAGLSRNARLSNVSKSYSLSSCAGRFSGRPVLFFDDVLSSGSTASACAVVLASNGNADLRGFFLASPACPLSDNPEPTFR